MGHVLPSVQPDAEIGGKARALLALQRAGLPVPEWFAVPPGPSPEGVELSAALRSLGPEPYAVRSSAAAEDGLAHSFAGQFESFLRVPAADVPKRVDDVRASARSPRLAEYRREHNLPDPGEPAVLVQRLIDASFAGVAFSADPVTGSRGQAVIAAVAGTGEFLVAGEVEGETWKVDRDGSIVESPPKPLLSPAQASEIAALARRCAAHFGRPQDIEWAIDRDGTLWLLQSRPITTLAALSDPDDELCIWDNSNIAESYTGVTTPLTFSFARHVYEHVYRQFCRLMRVPPARLARASRVFPRMLGLVRGRVYYNLISWYRVLALLPGFNLNRRFMEQMMGVREPMPAEVVSSIAADNKVGRLADALALLRTLAGLVRSQLTINRQIRRFRRRLENSLDTTAVPLTDLSGEEITTAYRRLEDQLLHRWDAPLVNDFLAMIHHGVLRRLCASWLRDESLANHLLLDAGDIISAEPPRRIATMAALAAEIDGLPALLCDPHRPPHEKRRAVSSAPALAAEFEAYLARFGDRCLEELKLESPTVEDDPSALLASIGAMAAAPRAASPALPTQEMPRLVNPLKSLLFRLVLKQARRRVRDRENLRFERTRVFGRVRRLVRELGSRLAADGQLDDPRDVFYLELDEVLGAFEHTNASSALREIALGRKREFEKYRHADPPPDRFETRGPLHRHESFSPTRALPDQTGDCLQGAGACPGVVRGKVRVVTDPREARLEPGEILVAQQTDPGWVVLFPSAAGLLVERGSLLSHSAIVAREMHIPCVVSLPGLTRWLQTGDEVEFDGATGVVRKRSDAH